MIGWISLHRQIQSHWIWKDADKFKWWVDILLTVNNSPAKINIGYEIFECNRGQSIMSIQNWASRWNVSKDTARNFLKLLEKDKMILLENLKKTTRITVCKYDDYQSPLHDKQTDSKRKPNAKQTPTHPNNNEDTVNNENNEDKPIDVVGSKAPTLYQNIVAYWLKEFHPGWTFSAQHGKEINSIVSKIKTVQKTAGKKSSDESVLESFKLICENLPEWYIDKDLAMINSKFNEILTEVKNKNNGKSITSKQHSSELYRS